MTRRPPLFTLACTMIAVLPALLLCTPRTASARSDNPPAKYTGAPGDGDCLQCHGLSLNDGVGSASIAVTGIGTGYVPGQVYDVTVTVARAGRVRWGFSLTALRNSNDTMAGALASAGDNLTATRTATVGGSSRTYIGQATSLGADGTFDGTANGPVTWTVRWTAPAAGTGAVTLYACALATDSSGNADEPDQPYVANLVVQELIPTATSHMTWGMIKSHYR